MIEPRFLPCEDFIREMETELRDGFGFVPLAGAGLSASGGIPLVDDVESYLARCVAMALRPDGPEADAALRWNPSRDRWPPFVAERQETRIQFDRIFEAFRRKRELAGPGTNADVAVYQEALGAIANWRSSLHFLSRLIPDDAGQLRLGAPRSEVIDTFFLHVVRQSGARPTLAHRMLAWLSSTIRADTILTTNFDELLEQAFEEIGLPVTVFDIHINAGLPAQRVCELRRSLIKLHGGRYGLRADHTLDASPPEADREQFISYLAGAALEPGAGSEIKARRHVLVVGFSGRDQRILSFLRHAVQRMGASLRIFWVCHSPRDEERVVAFQAELGRACISACRAPHLGLFLLQTYQAITKRIPSSGMLFPSVSDIPMPPEMRGAAPRPSRAEPSPEVATLAAEVEQVSQKHDVSRLVAVAGPGSSLSHFKLAAHTFNHLRDSGQSVLWLDMNDVASVQDLLEKLLNAIAKQSGVPDWMPLPLDSPADQKLEITHRLQASRRNWIVFFNCAEGVGTNLIPGPLPEPQEQLANGWIDLKLRDNDLRTWGLPSAESTASGGEFLRFLRNIFRDEDYAAGHHQPASLTGVIVCNDPLLGAEDGFLQALAERERLEPVRPEPDLTETIRTIAAALAWAGSDPAKLIFLLAITALRRVRYPALLWSWGCHVRGSSARGTKGAFEVNERFESTKTYVEELSALNVIYIKAGGFVWLPRQVRDGLQRALRDRTNGFDTFPSVQAALMRMHHGFAEWYMKLYAASSSWEAAFECIYHRCANAAEALYLARATDAGVYENYIRRVSESVGNVLGLLKLAEPDLLAGQFSRAACQQLVYLRQVLVTELRKLVDELPQQGPLDAIKESLGQIEYESMRLNETIAREVCEHAKAFERLDALDKLRRTRERDPLSELKAVRERGILSMSARGYCESFLEFRSIYERAELPAEVLAELALPELCDGLGKDIGQVEGLFRKLGDWAMQSYPNADRRSAAVLAVAKTLRRNVQLLTMISRARYYSEKARPYLELTGSGEQVPSPWNEPTTFYLDKAERCHVIAQELLRMASPRATTERVVETIMLKTHSSFVYAARNDFGRALRLLSEAEALAGLTADRPNALNLAVIELHRAEVRTQRAVRGNDDAEAERGRRKTPALSPKRDKIVKHVLECRSVVRSSDLKAMLDPSEEHRESIAYLNDALRALNRAEPLLRSNRKNVWWVGWYFQHRLKVAEWLLWASAGQQDSAPLVGFDDAPEGVPTEVDVLLAECLRVMRLDINRLAHAVESYASILLAVWVRLEVASNSGPRVSALWHRLGDMRRNCRQALGTLEARRNERKKRPVSPPLDTGIDLYARGVVAFGRYVTDFTEGLNPRRSIPAAPR